MNKLLMTLAAFVMTVSLATPQLAEAKRFGGGGSFGQQKSMPVQQRKAPPQQQQAAQPPRQAAGAAGAATGSAKWLGPLAGLAAGGLLAWMIFGEGFEGFQFMDVLLFGLIALGLFMFLRARRRQQQTAYESPQPAPIQQRENMGGYAQAGQGTAQPQTVQDSGSMIGSALGLNALHNVDAPSWFDEASFVNNAKQHFMSVQKAWDQGDAAEIESYCTPQLYEQLQVLMAGIVVGENHTEVDTLYTEIVDQSVEDDYFVVSVRFSGFIKESHDEPSHAFNEVWHIRRLQKGEGNWQIAGIQQLQ